MVFRLMSLVAGLVLAFAANAQRPPSEEVDYVVAKALEWDNQVG